MNDLFDKYGKTSIMALIAYLAANPELVGDLLDMVKGKKSSLAEDAKPDFLDLDKDGDKEESMKSAADDAKEKKVDEAMVRKTIREAITKALKNREA